MLIIVIVPIWLAALVFFWASKPTHEPILRLLASITLSYFVLWGVAFLWSNAPGMEMAKRFLLTTVSIAFTVGFFELLVAARVVDFRTAFGTPVYEPWAHPGNLLDKTLLHIHKPHDHWLWFGIDYSYDQHGLRNESDFETAELVVIGDSFIEGLGVSAADLLTAHLPKLLPSTVANLGQSWYGPQQELELLWRYGLPLRPKICVWTFFEGNDLADIARYNEATRDWENFSKRLHSFTERSFSKNALIAVRRLLESVKHSGAPKDSGLTEISGVFQLSTGEKKRLHFWYKGHHLSADDHRAVKELSSILRRAYEACCNSGAKFLVVLVPTKFRVYKEFAEFDSHARSRYWVVNGLPKMLEAVVRKKMPEAGFLDLTPAFKEQARRGSLVYFPYDSHWSPEGHRVAAAAIADFVTRWEFNHSSGKKGSRIYRRVTPPGITEYR